MLLLDVFAAATDGRMPPPDGQVEVHPGVPGKAAVVAFPAHFYVLAPTDPQWVRAQLAPGDYSAPLGALSRRARRPHRRAQAVLAGRHVHEATVVTLERHRHRRRRAVPVLGDNQIRLASAW